MEPELTPAAIASLEMVSKMAVSSSAKKRFATSPTLRRPLMSSTICSRTIWVSSKRNTTALPWPPASSRMRFRSSAQAFLSYDLEISIERSLKSAMDADSVARLLRPLPPTPTRRACPDGWLMTREMRDTCSMALRKRTSDMGFRVMALKSSR